MKKEHFYLLILGFIWGISFIFQKILTPIYGSALTAGVRLFIGGLFLCIIAIINKKKIFKKEYMEALLVFGIVNGAIPFTLFSLASLFIPSTFSVLANSMTPIMTALLSFIILKDRLTLVQAIGLTLGVFGISLSILQGGVVITNNTYIGMLFCFVAITCYALSFVYFRMRKIVIPSEVIGGGSQVIGGIILLTVAIFWHPQTINVTASNFIILIIFAIFCSGIAYYLFYEIQHKLSPLEASLVTLVVPIFGITLGVIVLHEPLTLGFLIGSAMTLLGVYFVIILNRQINNRKVNK